MNNDRKVIFYSTLNRKQVKYVKEEMFFSEFLKKLRDPVRTEETMQEYLRMPKDRQSDLKDVGGFCFANLKGGFRRNSHVLSRDVVTLDLDNILPGETDDVLKAIELMECGAVVYSTKKHTRSSPRLRVLILLNRSCTPDEYEPIARFLANALDIKRCDPTTFQIERMMFYPAVCKDGEYIFRIYDKPMVDADGVLETYKNWKDMSEWARLDGHDPRAQIKKKQQDPEEKKGIIGAFCRTYSVSEAMAAFIPEAYIPSDTEEGRYTYSGSSTFGGAIVYDDKFLYSHHASDPCSGKLVNAFDLVRLHLFRDADTDIDPKTPITSTPSYAKMASLALSDERVKLTLAENKIEEVAREFTPVQDKADSPIDKIIGDDNSWMKQLSLDKAGNIKSTINNASIIIQNTPELKGKIYYDEWCGLYACEGPLPWDSFTGSRAWTDYDDSALRAYLENLSITGEKKILDGLSLAARAKKRNLVKDYMDSLKWDGVSRLDTLFIKYLGAENSSYVRVTTRKMFVAAVKRVYLPGVKFDQMMVLIGPQGIGKSSILELIAGQWYTSGISSFDDKKKAIEVIKNYLIVEVAELQALNKSEMNAVKAFLSDCKDDFRESYARRAQTILRRQVFFGTTNYTDCLPNDPSGNRRFWPIECKGLGDNAKKVFDEIPEIRDQIWAEAKHYYEAGESLLLNEKDRETALKEQEAHIQSEDMASMIEAFINKKVPQGWDKKDIPERLEYWKELERAVDPETLVERDRICALEVYIECLDGRRNDKGIRNRIVAINSVIKATGEWEEATTCRNGPYGTTRGWNRKRGQLRGLIW